MKPLRHGARRHKKPLAIIMALCVSMTSAFACTVCNSEAGKQVRAGIFGEGFADNILLTLAPFPVLIGLIALVCWALPDSKRSPSKSQEKL